MSTRTAILCMWSSKKRKKYNKETNHTNKRRDERE